MNVGERSGHAHDTTKMGAFVTSSAVQRTQEAHQGVQHGKRPTSTEAARFLRKKGDHKGRPRQITEVTLHGLTELTLHAHAIVE